ncbi:sigma factor-like helix-turn-helix DNA-binding protein [Kribbella jejuensis]|uniref:RNA polymerase sigma factor (Sigma-70 family) n=1 Tax=Kribbella jejuensis TaxID=236068 RepID=A0A542D9H1_9ACTN|nr:sigma-70 family RNA polymerase sigma factor [Kribbella jejuensis]TQI99722.1 RNA polymerase sigma factor (sigma-70 family) [Kribbella jejuensis]
MLEDLLREQAPQVLGALVRRYGDFDACEDAVQEALLAASLQWPADGVPANPRSWLITVASRRRIEVLRSEAARTRREETVASWTPQEPASSEDDSLTLLMLCCHPDLTPQSQVALTLRAVGGLTTGEIARAFLVPEATIGQRISRAKAKLQGAVFAMPPAAEQPERLAAVLHVLYLIFNEGYTASSGTSLHRVELSAEAIRLTRLLHAQLPAEGEVAGLLALMLLTDARRPARTTAAGALVPLPEQDRTLWDAASIAEGIELIEATLRTAPVGRYQLQAAIAAVHDSAASADETDWREILMLYELLESTAPGPMVTLNRIVAVAMVHGPAAGLRLLDDVDPALRDHHRLAAVRAHLLELAGDAAAAREAYELAARLTQSTPEQVYLLGRAASLGASAAPS